MGIIEPILVGLAVHLGRKGIDWIWNAVQSGGAPVANQSGNLGFATVRDGRTIVGPEFTVPQALAHEQIVGELYYATTLSDILLGDEVALMLFIEQTQGQALLFAADLEAGYEIYLPHGLYSAYVLLMDADAPDFLDAEIYAVGFPSIVDLSGIEQFQLDTPEDVWNMVSDLPNEITWGGPYRLDFVLVETEVFPELPMFFSELLEDDFVSGGYDLTGFWQLYEEYEFGITQADLYLVQVGNQLLGHVIIQDRMDDGSETIIEQTVAGGVQGENVALSGTDLRVLRGRVDEYYLDQWEGVVEHDDRIVGYSEDLAGTTGVFVMERVLR
jgi:hypothetical protein